MKDPINLKGRLSAYIIDPKWKGRFPTRIPKEQWPVIKVAFDNKNTILNAGRLRGKQNGYKFNFIAGGTGTTSTQATDIILHNEIQRFDVIDVVYTVSELNVFSEIAPGTGNITWQEWGMFMDDATNNRNSGTMFSRVLSEYHKNIGDTVLLNYTVLETLP